MSSPAEVSVSETREVSLHCDLETKVHAASNHGCGCFQKINGKTPQIIHLFIGFGTMIFTIHFGGKKIPLFLETPMCLDRSFHVICSI